jgi:DNA gyrase subunit A
MATREVETSRTNADFIEHLFTASTHDYLMFFTNLGRVYVERVHEIPDMPRTAKGRSIANLLELKADEKVAAADPHRLSKTRPNKEDLTWQQPGELFFATRQGTVKKPRSSEFGNVRKGGIIAITIEPGDTLIDVKAHPRATGETDPGDDVVLITQRRHEHPLPRGPRSAPWAAPPPASRHRTRTRTRVVALAIVDPDATLLVAGENGIGKRTGLRRVPASIPRRQRHHHHEDHRQNRRVVGALTVRDDRRNHAHHHRRPDGPHPCGDIREAMAAKHDGRETHQPAKLVVRDMRQTPGHRPIW